jgi:hypothetical protein
VPRNNIKYNLQIAREIFHDAGCHLLAEEYKTCSEKMEYICVCGTRSSIKLSHFLSGVRCRNCAAQKSKETKKHDYDYVYSYFKEHGCELLESVYENNSTKMQYLCVCGRESEINFGNFRKGKRCRDCGNQKLQKENNPNWNPKRTHDQRVKERKTPEYHSWRMQVYERDEFSCKLCEDDKGGNLIAHHLNGYDLFPEDRYRVSNGLTLCEKCHKKFHFYFGYGENSVEQFKLFIKFNRRKIEEVLPK